MINVEFFKKGEIFAGFIVKNHSGYEQSGKDIVCSAVTSAVQMAINTITEIAEINVKLNVDEKKSIISLELMDTDNNKNTLQNIILKGLLIHLKNIQQDYPDNLKIKVTEV